MKNLSLIVCLSFFITTAVIGQTIDINKGNSSQLLHDNYIDKYKTNKKVGWILLGSGIGMIIGGGAVFAGFAAQDFNGPAPVTAEALFFVAGPSAALASIPFFISAKRNKTKAKLLLKGESVVGNDMLRQSNYTALAINIQL